MIKINPLDKVLHAAAVSASKKKGENASTSFADILSKTGQVSAPGQVKAPLVIQPILRTPLASTQEVYQSTERMLDAMEKYQNLLGDPKNNLKKVAPSVDQLKQEVDSLSPLLQGMDEKDLVAGIAREVMILANKEITRFEDGGYVEDGV